MSVEEKGVLFLPRWEKSAEKVQLEEQSSI